LGYPAIGRGDTEDGDDDAVDAHGVDDQLEIVTSLLTISVPLVTISTHLRSSCDRKADPHCIVLGP
jgi:hypothetical protein